MRSLLVVLAVLTLGFCLEQGVKHGMEKETKNMEDRVRQNAVETNGVDRVKSVHCKREGMLEENWKCELWFIDLDQQENYERVFVINNKIPPLFVIQTW